MRSIAAFAAFACTKKKSNMVREMWLGAHRAPLRLRLSLSLSLSLTLTLSLSLTLTLTLTLTTDPDD